MTKPVDENVQGAEQSAQQIAEQALQAARQAAQQAEQAVQAAQQASRGVGAETSAATIETEVSPASIGKAWAANLKRTYDEFQDVSLIAARRSQTHYDQVSNVSLQALQNAVESANMLSKQAIAHRDIAIDREWNVNETDAYATILAAKIAEALNVKK